MRLTFILTAFLILNIQTFAQRGAIYVSDAGNFNNPPWQILKFDENGQNPYVFISDFLNWPQDILFLEDQNEVLISNLGSGCINVHDGLDGTFLRAFACNINGPTRIAFGPDSLLYVLQWSGNGLVKRYDKNGNYVDDFTIAGVPQSIGLDWDQAGNLYVSSYSQDNVTKFDTAGQFVEVFIDSNLAGPTNIWFDQNGDLLVIDYDGTAVKRFNANGDYQGDYLSGLFHAEGVDYLPNGNILIGNGSSSSIKEYMPNGALVGDFVQSGAGSLLNPNAVVFRDEAGLERPELEREDYAMLFDPSPGSTVYMIGGDVVNDADSIILQDSRGKVLERRVFSDELDMALYPSGMYFVTLRLYDGNTTTMRMRYALNDNN